MEKALKTGAMHRKGRELIVFQLGVFDEENVADIRVFYMMPNGVLRPTHKGIRLEPKQLDEFLTLVKAWHGRAKERWACRKK
jgi:hypothetical protein